MKMSEILNLEKYPLDNLESIRGKALIRNIQLELAEDGSCSLEDFVTADALESMSREAKTLYDAAYAGPTEVTPYYFNYHLGDKLEVDDHHPLKRKGKRKLKQVAADLIPADHLLSILFHSPLMTDFLGAVTGQPVYRNEDEFQSLNINFQDQGGCQQWHFDTAHMVTTLLLQAPQEGGIFEYAPNIRSESNENFEAVRAVLDETSDQVKQIRIKPGMLSLFKGHYSIHRVTEIQGDRQRIQAILGYTHQPGLTGSRESSILHYGERVAEKVSRNPVA